MATAHSSEDEQPSVIEARRAPGHPDSALVYGATVQLPTFDKAEPRAWFRIADANFGIRCVTDPVTKYYYVLSKLDSETLRKLSAFLDCPPDPTRTRTFARSSARRLSPPRGEIRRFSCHQRCRRRSPCRVRPRTSVPPRQRYHRRSAQARILALSQADNPDSDHQQSLCRL